MNEQSSNITTRTMASDPLSGEVFEVFARRKPEDPLHHIGYVNAPDAELAGETDYKKRFALWERVTRTFYDRVPVARYGDLFGLRAMRQHVKGFDTTLMRPRFHNVWLEK